MPFITTTSKFSMDGSAKPSATDVPFARLWGSSGSGSGSGSGSSSSSSSSFSSSEDGNGSSGSLMSCAA